MKTVSALFAFLFFTLSLTAQNADINTAISIANTKLVSDGKTGNTDVTKIKTHYSDSGQPLFYEIELSPAGYFIISANKSLPPVIAYSYTGNPDPEGKFLNFVKADLTRRIKNIDKISYTQSIKINEQWAELNSGYKTKKVFQQWPEVGSTTSGGWVETYYTQNSPYNNFCPVDPSNDNRSIAGCPSVAMAMIVDFHKTTNQVTFSDADDYHHVYAGRNYWIDDDYIARDFPSWPMLNDYLDTLQIHFINGIPPTNNDKAALVFACGVAAKQVYTSTGSGTFSVSQAYDAYLKFNYTQAQLLDTSNIADSSFYKIIIQNIKDTMPVHLAIVDSLWTMGHNIVADGYNTDGFFHFNFGWGGSANGWYLMLDAMPYSMNFVEGAVVNIKPNSGSSIKKQISQTLKIFPNPATGNVNIQLPEVFSGNYQLRIWDDLGRELIQIPVTFSNEGIIHFDVSLLSPGLYAGSVSSVKYFYNFRFIKS